MEDTLRVLGNLLLAAIPTVVIFTLLFAIYRTVLHKPLVQCLEKRHDLTEGAVEKARADVAAAAAKTEEYEQQMRDARAALYKAQEARRQQALQVRSQLVAEARAKAEERVKQTRAAMAEDVTAAKRALEAEGDRLASEVIRTILKPVGSAAPGMGH